jgi:hypothetical protein
MASILKVTEITTPDGTGNITVSRPLSSVQLGGVLDVNGNYVQTEKGGDIASASPLVIDTDGDYFDVTGTTNFAAMTVAADRQFTLQFDGALTMTHHATNLDLPGEANITTAAGDVAVFQSTGANTVQCIAYTKADGTGVVSAGGNKTIWLPSEPDAGSLHSAQVPGGSVLLLDAATRNAYGSWVVPDDFTSLTSIKVYTMSRATGNAYMLIKGFGRNTGDDRNTGGTADTIAVTTYAMLDEEFLIIDITAAWNGLTFNANELMLIEVERQASDANDTVNDIVCIYGFEIVYS